MEGETIKFSGDETLSDLEILRQRARGNLVIDLLGAFTIGKFDGCTNCGLGLAEPGTHKAFKQYEEILGIFASYRLTMHEIDKYENASSALAHPEDRYLTE